MALHLKTPPIGTRGVFQLKAPFDQLVNPAAAYTVEGHRTFIEMSVAGDDPYELIYLPLALMEEDYDVDRFTMGSLVITLIDDNNRRVLVPNTYILSYPETAIIKHGWVVAVCSMGIMPLDYDFQRIRDAIVEQVSDYVGVEPEVYFTERPTKDAVIEEEAEQLAAIRQAAIKNRTTLYAQNLQLTQKVTELEAQIADLLEIVSSGG